MLLNIVDDEEINIGQSNPKSKNEKQKNHHQSKNGLISKNLSSSNNNKRKNTSEGNVTESVGDRRAISESNSKRQRSENTNFTSNNKRNSDSQTNPSRNRKTNTNNTSNASESSKKASFSTKSQSNSNPKEPIKRRQIDHSQLQKSTPSKDIRPAISLDELERAVRDEEVEHSVNDFEKTEQTTSFQSIGISKQLIEVLTASRNDGGMGFVHPTLVQSRVIPTLLQGRDMVIKSHTGSGKTLTFALPIVNNLHSGRRTSRDDGLYALILSPTRELCFQITQVLEAICKPFHWIVVGSIVGGEKRKSEKARIRKGINIMVATPGRFQDHLDKTTSLASSLKKNKLRWLVLDEADRLLDAGFSKPVHAIIDFLNKTRDEVDDGSLPTQKVLLSATLDSNVQQLARDLLFDPVLERVDDASSLLHSTNPVTSGDETSEARMIIPKKLVQHYVLIPRRERLVGLCAFLLRQVKRSGNSCRIVVFVSCRSVVEFLYDTLSKIEWPPKRQGATENTSNLGLGTRYWKLHGNMEQQDRRRTVSEFSKTKGGVLICTDVAARGLDLIVDWIIQYDPPSELAEYVHRVGRTARSGRKGSALLFLSPEEEEYVELLQKNHVILTQIATKSIYLELIQKAQPAKTPSRNSVASRAAVDPDAAAALLQVKLEDIVDDSSTKGRMLKMAQEAYLAFVRAYAVHSKETKTIFHPKKLHLGHVARSFGLREQPTGITGVAKARREEKKKGKEFQQKQKDFEKQVKKQNTTEMLSEFAAY